MTKYAVVAIKGKQYKVSEGDELLIDKHEGELETKVLLLAKNGKVTVGKPVVKGAKVVLKVLKDDEKGKKITVVKYKAKSRYRRKYGFRPRYTRLLVEKIS